MNTTFKSLFFVFVVLSIALSACGPTAQENAAAYATLVAQLSATPTLSVAGEVVATMDARASQTPAATATPVLANTATPATATTPTETLAAQAFLPPTASGVTPTSTMVASNTPAPITDNGDQRAVGPQGNESRIERMLRLDKVFRSTKSVAAWLEAAGLVYNWTPDYFDARQPEEETLSLPGSTKIVVSGQQVDVRGLYVQWPACLTTDKPSRVVEQNNTHKYQPDPSNGSTLYTNATTSGDGKVTVWVDCSNWGQLAPNPTPQP